MSVFSPSPKFFAQVTRPAFVFSATQVIDTSMVQGSSRKDLDDDNIQAIYKYLLENTVGGKL